MGGDINFLFEVCYQTYWEFSKILTFYEFLTTYKMCLFSLAKKTA